MPADPDSATLDVLENGQITIQGRFLWGSNYTFLVNVEQPEQLVKAVYKPTRGERPLWDFPAASLAHREAAAYLVSQALNWRLVPETVYRRSAPAGPGSLQRYVEHDPDYHYFNFEEEDRARLRPVAVFDLLINNADRKGGHVLKDSEGHLWLIDHGICFHVEDKLRTVIWDFAGESIPPELLADIERLHELLAPAAGLTEQLLPHLRKSEIKAINRRACLLLETGAYPNPDPDRRPYPWPPV